MATDATATAPQHRLSAAVALISGVAALIAVLAFTIDSFWNLLIALIGAAVVVTGGWYVVANRGTRRFVAALVAALGVVLAVLGLVGVTEICVVSCRVVSFRVMSCRVVTCRVVTWPAQHTG